MKETKVEKEETKENLGEKAKNLGKITLRLWRTKLPWVLGVIGLCFIIPLIAYFTKLSFVDAVKTAFCFVILWVLLYFLAQLLFGLLVLVLYIGISLAVGAAIAQGGDMGIIGYILGFIIVAVVAGLIMYALFLAPGIIAGAGALAVIGNNAAGVIGAIIAFAIVTGIMYLVVKYIIPFLWGLWWAFTMGFLAHKISTALVLGYLIAEHSPRSARDLTSFIDPGSMLFFPPPLLTVWIIIVSIGVGIVTVFADRENEDKDKKGE